MIQTQEEKYNNLRCYLDQEIENMEGYVESDCGLSYADELHRRLLIGLSKESFFKSKQEGVEVVTRLEVIENGERKYVKHDCKIELSYQDDGRTLKIFVEKVI